MDKKVYQKHCILFCIVSTVILLLSALLVITVDPFFQYHKPLSELYYLIENKISQNPGMAKHFDYDSVILGSSMTANFDTVLFEEHLSLHPIKLTYDGAYPQDIDNIMYFIKESGNELQTIFLGIDISTYKTAPGIIAYKLPEYLYDDSILTDLPYLLNKEVILDYIIRPQIEKEGTPLNEAYWSWIYLWYGKDIVALTYHAPEEFKEALPTDYYADNIAQNLNTCILPHIEEMSETKFVIFFPPYSVLYWYDRYAGGDLEAEFAAQAQIMETLFAYPNVEIYYFQNQFSYITDLENYSDYTHYRHEMNDYMTECFATGEHQVTAQNYQAVLAEMQQWTKNCDYEAYLP